MAKKNKKRTLSQWEHKYNAKIQSAKDRGIPFEIPLMDYIRLMSARRCYFSGRELFDENRSLDRLNNDLEYVKGNVVSCLKEFNTRKSNLTPREIKQMYLGMKQAGVYKRDSINIPFFGKVIKIKIS